MKGDMIDGKTGQWVPATKELRDGMAVGTWVRFPPRQVVRIEAPTCLSWNDLKYDVWIPDTEPMGETLNGRSGRWVKATKELRDGLRAGTRVRLLTDRLSFSVSTPNWEGWDALDYDIWVPDPVPTVLDRVKEFEKRSPGIFMRNVGRTTAAVYRACERVVAGESLVYVVGNEHDAKRVTEMAGRFFAEEFKAKFYHRKSFGDFIVTHRVTPGTWGPREHIAALAVRVCATVKDYEDLRYGRGEVAFANDYSEWASEHLKQVGKFETQIKGVEVQAAELKEQLRAIEGDQAELRASLEASEKRAKEAETRRDEALVRLSDMRHAMRRAMGDESEVAYATYARVPVAKDQSSIGVQASCGDSTCKNYACNRGG